MGAQLTLIEAVSKFGAAAKAKLDNPAVTGQPEEQLLEIDMMPPKSWLSDEEAVTDMAFLLKQNL